MKDVFTLTHVDYEDTYLVGIFSSFQGAAERYKKIIEDQVEQHLQSCFRDEMFKAYQDSNEMPVSTIAKPVFDQSMRNDLEYVARHSQKMHEWRETHEKPFRQSLDEYWQRQQNFLASCDYLYWREQIPEKFQKLLSKCNERSIGHYVFEEAVIED